jgi:diguanylate cyclase (GGDEF)-like protein
LAVGKRARPRDVPAPSAPAAGGEDVGGEALLTAVSVDLADADSGIEFVYRSLDRLRRRGGVDDVVVIVDEEPLGRQAFRAGRRPIERNWERDLVERAAPGIHTRPRPLDGAVASCVHQLCRLALRLDVARHDALHDGLTGLLNRRAFDEILATAAAQSQRYGWSFALVLLDLDGFKSVNDRLGHAVGDLTLKAVGSELRHRSRVGDAAARIGGDEFALVLPNAGEPVVHELIDRIEKALEVAVPHAGVSLSAGHAVAPDDGQQVDDLFRIADQRLYEAKQR